MAQYAVLIYVPDSAHAPGATPEDLDAALAIAGANPVVREGGAVEVRPVHSSYLRPAG